MVRLRGRDVASLPNLVSVVGLMLTVHGARRLHTPVGIAEVAVGRALDQSSQFAALRCNPPLRESAQWRLRMPRWLRMP